MNKTFTIRGQKIRTGSMRRYIVVACRPEDMEGRRWDYRTGTYVPETYQAFKPTVIRRSDDSLTARKVREKHGDPAGGWCIVVDTLDGSHFHPSTGWLLTVPA